MALSATLTTTNESSTAKGNGCAAITYCSQKDARKKTATRRNQSHTSAQAHFRSVYQFLMLLLILHSEVLAETEPEAIDRCLNQCGILEDPYGSSPTFRTMGGASAPSFVYPSIALLEFGVECGNGRSPYLHRCTGFIVDHMHIVSSAHCFYASLEVVHRHCYDQIINKVSGTAWIHLSPEKVNITLGTIDLNNPELGVKTIIGVSQLVVPLDFDPRKTNVNIVMNDYGVLKLNERNKLTYNHWMRSICIPKYFASTEFEFGQVAGWGKTKTGTIDSAFFPSELQEVALPIQNSTACEKKPMMKELGFNKGAHLCTGTRRKGLLEGDSGAPLIVSKNGRQFAIGIFSTSTTVSEMRNARPDVFIKTSAMCEFLQTTIGRNICIDMDGFDEQCRKILEQRANEPSSSCGTSCPFVLSAGASYEYEKGNKSETANNPGFSAERDARALAEAMEGTGTTENTLIEILASRSNLQIQQIKKAYLALFNRDLENDVSSDTDGIFTRLLLDLLRADRDETSRTDPNQAMKDAKWLYEHGEAVWGTDSDSFVAVLANQNRAQLKLMFGEYQKLAGHTFEEALNTEFSGDELEAMQKIADWVRNGELH